MTDKKQHPIKAVVNFRSMTPAAVVSAAKNISTQMYVTLKDAPAPPVDQATLNTSIDALVTANAAAIDGGKKALQQQKHQKEAVVKLLILLAHYAEANSKDDMNTFLATGFRAAASTKSKTPPLSESIRKVAFGSVSGQILLTLIKFIGAASYEVRWAPVPAGGGTPTT